MKKMILVALGAALAATPATAGQKLWQDAEVGMSKEAILAQYKDSYKSGGTIVWWTPSLVGKCDAQVFFRLADNKLDHIVMSGSKADGCYIAVQAGLNAKYGQPQIGGLVYDTWVSGGLTITMRSSSETGFELTYRSVEPQENNL